MCLILFDWFVLTFFFSINFGFILVWFGFVWFDVFTNNSFCAVFLFVVLEFIFLFVYCCFRFVFCGVFFFAVLCLTFVFEFCSVRVILGLFINFLQCGVSNLILSWVLCVCVCFFLFQYLLVDVNKV